MNSLKISYRNVKILNGNVNEKVNDFRFLNEEAEEFKISWSRSWATTVESPSYLKEKSFKYCLSGINR